MTSNSLALGDPVLDQEHAELQRLIDALRQAQPADALAALDALQAHAASHFGLEDADLRRLGGANASCHLDEHAAVLRSLDDVRAVLLRDQPPADLVGRLAAELTRWLRPPISMRCNSLEPAIGGTRRLASVRIRARLSGWGLGALSRSIR